CGTSLPVGRSSMLPQLHVPPDTPPPRSSLSRRRFVGGAAAAAGAAALAGCGGGGASTDPSTLQVWSGLPPESGPQDLIDRFQEAHPDIPVRYTRYVNDDRGNLKVNTALQGGVDIDVFFTFGIANPALRGGTDTAADLGDRARATLALLVYLEDSSDLRRVGVLYRCPHAHTRNAEASQQIIFIAGDFTYCGTAPFSLRFLHVREEFPHHSRASGSPMPTVEGQDLST